MTVLPSQRHLFDVPDDVAYFNCASLSPQLNASRDRLLEGVLVKSHPWTRSPDDYFEDADTIRTLAAGLIGGDADGYAIIPAASYAASTIARALEPRLGSGDRILVIEDEFPSDVLPWRRVARETGATVTTVPAPADGRWTPAIVDRIEHGVTVVVITTCHWTDGAAIDPVAVAAACRDAGSVLVVDATQSLGARPFPFDEVRPDFLLAAGYKWLLTPYGVGLLYVAEPWRELRPLEESWITRDNARDFAGLARYSDTYRPGARRFDVGETCVPTLLPGAIAALEQLGAWSIDRVASSLDAVSTRIATRLQAEGWTVPDASCRSPHMFGARPPVGDVGAMVEALRNRRIFVSRRGQSLRISPHLHVNDDDVSRLLDALATLAS